MTGSIRKLVIFFAVAAALAAGLRAPGTAQEQEKTLSRQSAEALFLDQVKPLLVKRCYGCHGGGDALEANLDLRTRQGMLKGGDTGPVLVPGNPGKSPLYRAVLRDGDLVMPPKDRNALTKQETEVLRQWIRAGAPFAEQKPAAEQGGTAEKQWTEEDGVTVATSGGLSPDWTNRKYDPDDLWAYQPIRRYPVPWRGVNRKQTHNEIDAFIQAKLNERNLAPAEKADKRTLIRRATFDLTGLPPTPEEIEAFLNDDSDEAFRKVVDRLLESKHYGEQQARHWLDVVRYADTAGFSNDYERPNAWRYRDYVIRSLGDDKPFDRFILEQIAGDELEPDDPEMLLAVGFLRMGPWEHTGMSVAAVTRQQFLDDVTHHVGVTFLAQGLRCCRCHDHKFDPLPTRDYYRVQAVFAPVQFADREVPYLPEENTTGLERMKPRTEQQLQEAQDVLAGLREKSKQALKKLLKEYNVESVNDLPEKVKHNKKFIGLSKLEVSVEKIMNKRVAYFEREMKRYEPLAFSLYNGPPNNFQSNRAVQKMPPPNRRQGPPETIQILKGGALDAPLEKVTPGVLSAVSFSNDAATPTAWNSIPETMHGRRLAFARWVASPNNTLTARVIVNRIWQQHFGTGLVATSNNFGKMGRPPSHPQLLDWLATWFIEHDWSIKRLHRLIMSSATYQRSGRHPDMPRILEADPNNALLACYPPRRMAAEELRDAMLAVTGELNRETGGPGVFPEINWEVATQTRHIMGSVAPAYQPSRTPGERNRRTIYAFRFRTLANPLLEVLNRPNADVSCERRDETTVAPQALTLFNGQFAGDRALALAIRLREQEPDRNQRIDRAFRLLYGRRATEREKELCAAHVKEMTAYHRAHEPVKVEPPQEVTREMVEELTGEPFAWVEELDLMKNYVPDAKPWDVDAETRALSEICLVLLNSNEFLYVR